MAANPRLLLLGTGSIAVVKLPALAAQLRQAGMSVDCRLTAAAQQWCTIEALECSGQMASLSDAWSWKKAAAKADALLIAPASAATLAHLVQGDILPKDKPVMMAPAMNVQMWRHPATQRNVRTLMQQGAHFLGPVAGNLACGDEGEGRMMEPADIVAAVGAVMQGDVSHAGVHHVQQSLVGSAKLPAQPPVSARHVVLMLPGGDETLHAPALISALRKKNVTVTVAAEGQGLIPVAALASLTEQPVHTAHYEHDAGGFEHIRLTQQAAALVMLPLTTQNASAMRAGFGRSFLECVYLATRAPVLAVPAAGANAPTPVDLEALQQDGVHVLPQIGALHEAFAGERMAQLVLAHCGLQ